ncbi:MAG: adenylate/guanylate cyclase domain-containing protein [Thermodesulfobacteriota bacterium]|nr:adenylate/guanylate cyclase domain-containing protein [Thermodesulfobacteriota bacterium]
MEISRRIRITFLIGILITLLFGILMWIRFPPGEVLEDKLYDYRFKIRGAIKPSEHIVIAAIDEKSIGRFGRWPWSRDKIAQLVKRLAEGGAELIVLDIILSEHEKHDLMLGHGIQEAGNVLLPVAFEFDRKPGGPDNRHLLDSAFQSIHDPDRFQQYAPISMKRPLSPVPNLIREAMGLGHINMFPDGDGTLRWEAMALEFDGYFFPSIDLLTASIYLGVPREKMILKATAGIQLGEKRYIPTDRFGRSLIHYYGPNHTFPHLSIADILEGTIKPDFFLGKIVLVGATAVGIYDLRVTPFSAAMPGIEKHANVISSLLDNRIMRKATFHTDLILLILSGILFTLSAIWVKALGTSVITGLFLALISCTGYLLFALQNLWVNMAYPLNNVLLIYISMTGYNYVIEERYARKIRSMFSNYATERVVNALIKNPGMTKLGGERREITVLFSDIRGFTTFSEKHTPEEVVAMLNEYLGEMTDIIFRWDGTLDKFVGDEIVAFWGAPISQENHAELAVKCALNMVKRLKELQLKWESEGKIPLDSGIGINTGEALVGNIGAEGKKMDYTVIGDHVNLGARVEGLTRKYDARILITEFTLAKIREALSNESIYKLKIEGLEKVIVKGKEKPVAVYKLEEGPESVLLECKEDVITTLTEK